MRQRDARTAASKRRKPTKMLREVEGITGNGKPFHRVQFKNDTRVQFKKMLREVEEGPTSKRYCRVQEHCVLVDGVEYDFVEGDSLARVFGEEATLFTHAGFFIDADDVSVPGSLYKGRFLNFRTSTSGPLQNFWVEDLNRTPTPRMCGICGLPWGHEPTDCWYWDLDTDGEYCNEKLHHMTCQALPRKCRWCDRYLKPSDLHWECESCTASAKGHEDQQRAVQLGAGPASPTHGPGGS
jgi:hypothetical protein